MLKKRFCRAVAVIEPGSKAPQLQGRIVFADTIMGVRVDAQLSGLPRNETGFYGFHLHEGSTCEQPGFESAQGHYNPDGVPHPLHAGDFPMLLATDAMTARLSFITTRFSVCDIIGKTAVIHIDRDDYTSQPTGDAGERIGCGIIKAL